MRGDDTTHGEVNAQRIESSQLSLSVGDRTTYRDKSVPETGTPNRSVNGMDPLFQQVLQRLSNIRDSTQVNFEVICVVLHAAGYSFEGVIRDAKDRL